MAKKKQHEEKPETDTNDAAAQDSAAAGKSTFADAATSAPTDAASDASDATGDGQTESGDETAGDQTERNAEIMLRAETLVGNIRDVILDTIKHEKENKPWAQMTQAEQEALIGRCTSAAELMVRNTVDLVAQQSFVTARAEIDSWKVKGRSIVINLKSVASEENVLALLSGGGSFVNIQFANDKAFDQDRAPCKPDPDQPGLPLDGTNDEDAEGGDFAEETEGAGDEQAEGDQPEAQKDAA